MIKFSITGEYFSSSSHKKHQKKRSWVMSCCVGLSQPSLLNSFVTIYIYQFFSQLEIIFIVIIKLIRNVDVAISIWIIRRLYKLILKLLWQMKLVYELKIFQTSTFVFYHFSLSFSQFTNQMTRLTKSANPQKTAIKASQKFLRRRNYFYKFLQLFSSTCWVARQQHRIALEGLDCCGLAFKINICSHAIITN